MPITEDSTLAEAKEELFEFKSGDRIISPESGKVGKVGILGLNFDDDIDGGDEVTGFYRVVFEHAQRDYQIETLKASDAHRNFMTTEEFKEQED